MVHFGTVRQLDLAPFTSYRQDGWGRAAFEPQMMLSLLLYAYAQGERSARGIERLGLRDLFVLSPDGDRYFTADVRTAARNLGLRIVGSAT